MLNRTFGCVRVVWNHTLAARQARWHLEGKGTSYRDTDAALTAMKKDPELAFLNEASCVPLQQALRHQHRAFTLRGGELRLAKMVGPLWFAWTWPDVDPALLNPAMVIVAREPDGRWYVTFTIDASDPEPLPLSGRAVGVDLVPCQAAFAAIADVSTALTSSKLASALNSARRCFHRRPGTRSSISARTASSAGWR